MRIRTSLIGLTLACAACHPAASSSSAFAVRDSAGVRIAESRGAAWANGAGWKLAATPSVDIGVVEGDPHDLFSRVSSGAFLPGGGFVVADQSRTLRSYSPTGVFQWSAGRSGDGPGEFKGIPSVQRSSTDSLVAFDMSLQRVSIFTTDGEFVRSIRLHSSGMGTAALALPDGGYVVTTSGFSGLLPYPPPSGITREKDPAVHYGPTGDSLGTIGVFPGMEWFSASRSIGPPLFAHFTHFALRDSSLLVGTGDDMSVSAYGLDGKLEEIIRVPGVDLKITDAEVQSMKKVFLDRTPTPEARKREQARLDAMPIPERRPAYSHLEVDRQGDLWVSGYTFTGFHDRSWSVFAPDGRFLGKIPFPGALRVLDIDSTSVLGVWSDSLGVEHVRVYGIEKGS